MRILFTFVHILHILENCYYLSINAFATLATLASNTMTSLKCAILIHLKTNIP